jgi:hypothetical protein
MRNILIALALAIIAVVAGAYGYYSGKEYVIRLTEAELQAKLDQRFPIRRDVLFVVQIDLSNPRVHLLEGSNRVAIGIDVVLNFRLRDQAKSFGGSIDVDGGLRYEAFKGRFFLTDPHIQALRVDGIPEKYRTEVEKVVHGAISEAMNKGPIYTLSADAGQLLARLLLKSVVVRDRELVITLGI